MKSKVATYISYNNMRRDTVLYQSMHARGAKASHKIGMDFLQNISRNHSTDSIGVDLRLVAWNDKAAVSVAKKFYNKIIKDIGAPTDRGKFVQGLGIINDIWPISSIERYPSWKVEESEIKQYLDYIDTTHTPKELTDRPTLSLSQIVNFNYIDADDIIPKSELFLTCSANSNTLGIELNMPDVDDPISYYKNKLQALSPIEFSDKNFYKATLYTDGSVTYRHLTE